MIDQKSHWFPAYVGLGSNLDSPSRQVENAFDSLQGISATRLIARSSLYRSAPFGGIEQPDFVNAVAALLSQLSPHQLFTQLQRIEADHGRVRGEVRWGPRVLDLDLLVYANEQIKDSTLTLPHPGIIERNFVLLPLKEVAPDLSIPGIGSIQHMAASLDEPQISRIG